MNKTLFIVNPISGNGKKDKMLSAVRKYYTATPYEIAFTEYAGHAVEIARDTDADLIVAVGGDGTVSEVAKGILKSGDSCKTLSILPCGSGDGLALHLGISRNPEKAVKELCNAGTAMMDCARISDGTSSGVFFCTAGIGFDADVAEGFSKSKSRGLITYIKTSFSLWFSFKPLECKITADGKVTTGKALMVTVGNAAQWGNQARICPGASVTDGLLNVSMAAPLSAFKMPLLAYRLMTGRLSGTRELTEITGKHIIIERDRKGAAHYDGDPCFLGERIEIEIQPSALKVAVPKAKIERI